jgi:coenzyme F420-0:L-glutamate ligase/coenzyme F420-1:gamma-L-glutamate ligase
VKAGIISFVPVTGLADFQEGADLATEIAHALRRLAIVPDRCDVLVVAQKIVSKAEGRRVNLASVQPSSEAQRLAQITRKDPRLVELVLRESEEVVRAAPNVLIVRHRLGFVMANAGIDRSNVGPLSDGEVALLLPRDPDGSAARLRHDLTEHFRVPVAVIVSDSFGRPWRNGVVNIALGAAGLPAIIDRRGERDRYDRMLEATEVAFADCIAAGAALVMGEAAEGVPAVLARGLQWAAPERDGRALLRSKQEDLFR